MGNKQTNRASVAKETIDFGSILEPREEEETKNPKILVSVQISKDPAFSKTIAMVKKSSALGPNVVSQYQRLHPFALKQLKYWKI